MARITRLAFAAGHHLARHGVSEREAIELLANPSSLLRPRRSTQGARRLLVGSTHGGRSLTLVLEPTDDPGEWTVITGWDSTPAERRALRPRQ